MTRQEYFTPISFLIMLGPSDWIT